MSQDLIVGLTSLVVDRDTGELSVKRYEPQGLNSGVTHIRENVFEIVS
jgi:hypothetical protein